MSGFVRILSLGEDWGAGGDSKLDVWNLLDAMLVLVIVMLVVGILLMIFQLVIFTVVNFKCRKFRIRTLKENYRGMKALGIITEVMVFIDIWIFLVSLDSFIALINELSVGEFHAVGLIFALLPGLLLGYGIFTWIRFLKAKRLYDHMFPKVDRRAKRKLYDSALLFGDSKDPLEEQLAREKNKEKENPDDQNAQDIGAPSEIVSIDDEADNIIIPDVGEILMPSASGTVKKACPFCGYLSSESSAQCEFCGAEIK